MDENATQYVSRLEHFLDSWIQLSGISETFIERIFVTGSVLKFVSQGIGNVHQGTLSLESGDYDRFGQQIKFRTCHEKEKKGRHSPRQRGDPISSNHLPHVRSEKNPSRPPFPGIRCYLCRRPGHSKRMSGTTNSTTSFQQRS